MKTKPKNDLQTNKPINKQPWWLLIVVGGMIPLTLTLARTLSLPLPITITIILVTALIFGAMALWLHANAQAIGDEWWQDDHASGWRGY
ncbi:hypothetical protein G4Y79_03045 [Phototrophicus methaneseepsis]|uniref:Uncharacterized protein n=1 Tax=Phototrophicus methaneseepsis TaxID=2710758 RepID=A0A7S8EAI3_9CHLR|nr:hypothetical protein [Phototrophicus methaneseepsis]QPC83372.1 hypothetical protein G4Y79_03045 [Phototrophicus methaneseepsis]